MAPEASCLPILVDEAGGRFARILYLPDDDYACGDCGTAPGNFHHVNCDQEECPRCGGQLLTCTMLESHQLAGDEEMSPWLGPAAAIPGDEADAVEMWMKAITPQGCNVMRIDRPPEDAEQAAVPDDPEIPV
jgi:ribosomal protein S27AE